MSKYLFLGVKESQDRDPLKDKILMQDMVTGRQSMVGVNKASYLAGKGELVTNGTCPIEIELGLTNKIWNVSGSYRIIERCVSNLGRSDYIHGYIIVNKNMTGFMASVEDVLYLIGKGIMVNCVAQSYKEDGIAIRGKGIKLSELPERNIEAAKRYNENKIPNECEDYREVELAVMKYVKDTWEKGYNTKAVRDTITRDTLNLCKNNKVLMQVVVNTDICRNRNNNVIFNVRIPGIYLETRGINHVNNTYKQIYYEGNNYKKKYGFDKVEGDDIMLEAIDRLTGIDNKYLNAMSKCSCDVNIQLPIQTNKLISMVGKWLKEVAMPNYKIFITGFVTESEVRKMLPNKIVSKIEGIIKEI